MGMDESSSKLGDDGDSRDIHPLGVLHFIDGYQQAFSLFSERGCLSIERFANIELLEIVFFLD